MTHMDPNETLRRMRELAKSILDSDITTSITVEVDAEELAQLVQSLDGWITNGGFLPTKWAGRSCTRCVGRVPK